MASKRPAPPGRVPDPATDPFKWVPIHFEGSDRYTLGRQFDGEDFFRLAGDAGHGWMSKAEAQTLADRLNAERTPKASERPDATERASASRNGTGTPRPWRIGDAGRTVFWPPNGNPSPITVANVRSKTDASFIARACNAHDDVLAALQRIKNIAGSIRQRVTDPDLLDMARNIETDARNAIAKARGKT